MSQGSQAPNMAGGMLLSLAASVIFALLSCYPSLLRPLSGLQIFAWRVIFTIPGLLLLVRWRSRPGAVGLLLARLRGEPRVGLALLGSAALLGTQLWLFMWAPLHGRAQEVALGYFLLPLSMVLAGRVVYRESLQLLQWSALLIAGLGVVHEIWRTAAFAWPTLLVALGYPPYFIVRRAFGFDALASLALEMMSMLPAALLILADLHWSGFAAAAGWRMAGLLAGLGVLSTLALGCYLQASQMLPLSLFGILGYVEPILLVVIAVTLLGEPFLPATLPTYLPIWAAVLLTVVHGVRAARRR